MTSEICMMNRHAVILAADSASTVTGWNNGKREERYFKGANKVFQLSLTGKVGLMIYDSGDILNVPWELIIKSFRQHLGRKVFPKTEDYSAELLRFLNASTQFFPELLAGQQFINCAASLAFFIIRTSIANLAPKDKVAAIEEAFKMEAESLRLAQPIWHATGKPLEEIAAEYKDYVAAEINDILKTFDLEVSDVSGWADIVIEAVLKRPDQHLSTTGLVFAGYGEDEFFPSMVVYTHCGIIGGQHIFVRGQADTITHANPAWLSAFAQTSMTDTFSLGLSNDVYDSVMVAVTETLEAYTENIIQKCGGNKENIADFESLQQGFRDNISNAILEKANIDHSMPLKRVISVLPVEEMAELAETLILLQSLKEKFTKPSATVGGPVDVAIITKHEGLVWIKRKHFFDPDINSRFNLRLAAAEA